jgi:hypothetical protein
MVHLEVLNILSGGNHRLLLTTLSYCRRIRGNTLMDMQSCASCDAKSIPQHHESWQDMYLAQISTKVYVDVLSKMRDGRRMWTMLDSWYPVGELSERLQGIEVEVEDNSAQSRTNFSMIGDEREGVVRRIGHVLESHNGPRPGALDTAVANMYVLLYYITDAAEIPVLARAHRACRVGDTTVLRVKLTTADAA